MPQEARMPPRKANEQPDHGRPGDDMPLSEVREWLRERVVGRKIATDCPVCTQRVELYHRSVYATMARFLIGLYWMSPERSDGEAWVSARAIAQRYGLRLNEGGDRSKLRYWGLIEVPDATRPDGSNRTGYFKITRRGRAYVEDRLLIPKTAVIYNGSALRFEGPDVGIRDALRGKFDYSELMAGNG
jgi:hypothetical protein